MQGGIPGDEPFPCPSTAAGSGLTPIGAEPTSAAIVATFASTLVAWQREHGRQSLPWQQLGDTRDPYRIWLAEIMLQQTQVGAVVPFYRRFVDRFPDVAALAGAPIDDVMREWAGLGYYSRARNLHAAARQVVDVFGGRFPGSVDALMRLPGVGRSTAGAIAAFAYGRKAAILDGNVRRVLARIFLVDGVPSDAAFVRRLWALSESLLPDVETDIPRYTQGLMDLGATICTPRRPACLVCPFERVCGAHREGREEALPQRRPRRAVPTRRITLSVVTRGDTVLLERRPPSGIWGGLWSLPEAGVNAAADADTAAAWCGDGIVESVTKHDGFVHAFTHFVLQADIVRVRLQPAADRPPTTARDAGDARADGVRWVAFDALRSLGLPTPIGTLLAAIER